MLKRNINKELGLLNGTDGIVKDFIWFPHNDEEVDIDKTLPHYVIVQFPNSLIKDSCTKLYEKCVPIEPIEVSYEFEKKYYKRR